MGDRIIPLVDYALFTDGDLEKRRLFIKDFGTAFHEIGFAGVKNHGIAKSLINEFYELSHSFFLLPREVKEKYEINGLAGQRGYTSFGKEHAKGSNAADLKEFFQIGRDPVSSDIDTLDNPKNVNVEELERFLELGKKLYSEFERVGAGLLKAISEHLNLPENYFEQFTVNGNSILRSIYYPPIKEEPKSAIRAEQHEDINLITLLVGASAGGLQLLDKKGEWQTIEPEDDEIVINVGDMLQRLTNNYLKSTTHRVVNPPRELWGSARLSIPFFLHPKFNMSLDCLESCVSEKNPKMYEPITAGDYLNERLREIGLKK